MEPLAAINEWCCSVTSVTWALNGLGKPITQEEIIQKFTPYFPEWKDRPGLVSRTDVLRLLEMNELNVGKYIQSADKEELCSFFSKNHPKYQCGFLQTRKSTNHCMPLVGLSGNGFQFMNCDRVSPSFIDVGWDFLGKTDADMLLVFQR